MQYKRKQDWDAKYEVVRDLIGDGDVFLFKGQYLLSRWFESLDDSYYSHAGMAAWWGDRLMFLQAEPREGIQAVPLSVAIGTYKGRVDWYMLLRESYELDLAEYNDRIQHRVIFRAKASLGLHYAFGAVIKNFFRRWIAKIPLANKVHPKAMFCSQYVEDCFCNGDMSLAHQQPITTFPKEIADSSHLQYMCTIPHNPALAAARDRDEVVSAVCNRVEMSIAGLTQPAFAFAITHNPEPIPVRDRDQVMSALKARIDSQKQGPTLS
jgi:hypothetical protein